MIEAVTQEGEGSPATLERADQLLAGLCEDDMRVILEGMIRSPSYDEDRSEQTPTDEECRQARDEHLSVTMRGETKRPAAS